MKTILLASMLISSAALADAGSGATAAKPKPPTAATKLTADKAKSLMRALKLAGVASTHVADKWTFTAKAIACHTLAETDDGLGSVDCQVDSKKLVGAPAAVLHDGLLAAGVEDAAGMSQTHMAIHALSCINDQAARGDASTIYTCSFGIDK